MPALRPLAIARDSGEILAALRAYTDEINVSRVALDEATGWPLGFCGKALSPRPVKPLNIRTLGEFMQATGLVLIISQDLDAFTRRKDRLPERNAKQARCGIDGRQRWADRGKPRAPSKRKTKKERLPRAPLSLAKEPGAAPKPEGQPISVSHLRVIQLKRKRTN